MIKDFIERKWAQYTLAFITILGVALTVWSIANDRKKPCFRYQILSQTELLNEEEALPNMLN